jgi:hypothetical protein
MDAPVDLGELTEIIWGRDDGPDAITEAELPFSWLQVSGTTEMPEIDQCVGHQFHTVVALLFEFKA